MRILCIAITAIVVYLAPLSSLEAGVEVGRADCRPDVGATDAVVPPRLISAPIAEYPGVAKMARIFGVVEMRVWVLADGEVCDVEVLRGPHSLLNAAARSAIRNAEFEPAQSDSGAVPGIADCSYLFDFVGPDDGRGVFGAEAESPFVSELVASGEAVSFTRNGIRGFRFEEVEVRGDMPVDLFRWIRGRTSEESGFGEPYLMEVVRVAVGNEGDFGESQPVVAVYACARELADGRCTTSNVADVTRESGGYVLGRKSVLYTDFYAK